MKSIIYELEAPYKLIQKEVELDESLASSEILAETEYSVISTGTELAAWVGKPSLRPSIQYPRLMGYCNLAKVIKLGTGVTDISVGDYILTHQSHRTAFVCKQSDVLLHVTDKNESMRKKISATYLYHLGYSALLMGCYSPGHHVAIIGMGAVGIATASLVKVFGSEPIIFTNQNSQFSLAFKKDAYYPGLTNELCDMDGVDIVINTSDSWSDYLLSLQLARKGGEVICIGFPGRGRIQPEFNPLDSQYLYDKQLSIKQCGYMPNIDVKPIDIRFTLKRNMRYLSTLIYGGVIDPFHILTKEFLWKNLDQVYPLLLSREAGVHSSLISWKS